MTDIQAELTKEVWKHRFKLDWTINLVRIDPSQVTYDPEIPEEDRYFIGITSMTPERLALIIHDRDLTEEAIVHELTHLKHPRWSEDKVNSYVKFIIEYYINKEKETLGD